MFSRLQFLGFMIMAALGGSFGGLLAVGIIKGDITLALINLCVIVAFFCCAFVIGSGSGGKSESEPDIKPLKNDFIYTVTWDEYQDSLKARRAGDIHVGGELNPEFK